MRHVLVRHVLVVIMTCFALAHVILGTVWRICSRWWWYISPDLMVLNAGSTKVLMHSFFHCLPIAYFSKKIIGNTFGPLNYVHLNVQLGRNEKRNAVVLLYCLHFKTHG